MTPTPERNDEYDEIYGILPVSTASWEEEFDNKFYSAELSELEVRQVKSFIRSLLKENTTATLREVREFVEERQQLSEKLKLFPERVHYNKALKDIYYFIQHKLASEYE